MIRIMSRKTTIVLPILLLSLLAISCVSHYSQKYDFYYRLNDWENAETDLRKDLTSDPDNPEIHFLLGQVYGHSGDFENMDRSFERASSISKRYVLEIDQFRELFDLEQLKKGLEAYNIGEFERAIEELRFIKNIKKDETRHHKFLGFAFSKLEQYEEARINLELAVDLTDDFEAKLELARVYDLTGESQGIIDITGEALESSPLDADLLTLRAMAYERLGLYSDAVSTYYDILQIDPQATTARHNLALLLSRTERQAEAIPIFEQLYREDTGNISGNDSLKYTICSLLYETEQYQTCLACFKEYLLNNPGDREALEHLFVLNRKLQNWDDAKNIRQQLKRLGQTDPVNID